MMNFNISHIPAIFHRKVDVAEFLLAAIVECDNPMQSVDTLTEYLFQYATRQNDAKNCKRANMLAARIILRSGVALGPWTQVVQKVADGDMRVMLNSGRARAEALEEGMEAFAQEMQEER